MNTSESTPVSDLIEHYNDHEYTMMLTNKLLKPLKFEISKIFRNAGFKAYSEIIGNFRIFEKNNGVIVQKHFV